MSTKGNPSVCALNQLLRYDPETGKLFWRDRDRNLSGLEAGGTASADGYRRIRINGQIRLAHRIILAMTTGDWPCAQVDHINGDRADNRLANLRSATRNENQQNKAIYRTNRSGVAGVYWHKQSRKWCAAIQCNGKRHVIGVFHRIEDAAAARLSAQRAAGFHINHGRASQ